MRLHLAAPLAVALVAIPGCFGSTQGDGPPIDVSDTETRETDACGDLGCSSGIYLSLVAEANVFDAGQYDVTFVIDGEVESCQFALSNGEPCGLDPVCVVDSRCDGPQIQFNFVIMPHTIGFVVGPEGESIEVDVERDGRPLLSQTLVPSYEDYAPNGTDCEPICRVAEAELPIP